MLIRSQDKESIINIDNIASMDIMGFTKTKDGYFQDYKNANAWKVTYTVSEEILYFAEYSTKEKAIKVLDMIQEEYLVCPYKENTYGVPHSAQFPKVFQMPADSEV